MNYRFRTNNKYKFYNDRRRAEEHHQLCEGWWLKTRLARRKSREWSPIGPVEVWCSTHGWQVASWEECSLCRETRA